MPQRAQICQNVLLRSTKFASLRYTFAFQRHVLWTCSI